MMKVHDRNRNMKESLSTQLITIQMKEVEK